MSKLGNFARYWTPLILWMALIFSASADKASYHHTSTMFVPLIHWLFPSWPEERVDALHHFIRKCGHFTEYAILGLLIRRAIINQFPSTLPRWAWRTVLTAIGLVFLYASSDEFHQSFVPGRTALFSDVLIDTAGGATGLFLAWGRRRLRGKTPA